MTTTGLDAYAIGEGNANIRLTGTTITTTSDGSGGIFVNGTGSTVTGTGLTIKVLGNYDTVNNYGPTGFTNESYPGFFGGGISSLTNSSILTTGTNAPGGYTASGGITTLNAVSIVTSGFNSYGVQTDVGGTTNITGGSFTTSGGTPPPFSFPTRGHDQHHRFHAFDDRRRRSGAADKRIGRDRDRQQSADHYDRRGIVLQRKPRKRSV